MFYKDSQAMISYIWFNIYLFEGSLLLTIVNVTAFLNYSVLKMVLSKEECYRLCYFLFTLMNS